MILNRTIYKYLRKSNLLKTKKMVIKNTNPIPIYPKENYPYTTDAKTLEWFICSNKGKRSFSQQLLEHIRNSKETEADIYNRVDIDRKHFYKIKNNVNYQPRKNTAIALCLALYLSLEETVELLNLAGYSLSRYSEVDLAIVYFIQKGIYDLDKINNELYGYNGSTLKE